MSKKKEENQSGTEELRCGLCLKNYQDPRQLNCLHSFCLDCLKDHVSKHKWKRNLLCPMCQKEMLIPKGGLVEVAKDFYIRARQEVVKLKPTSECEVCDSNEFSKSRCLDCQVNLCKNCKAKHSGPDSQQVHHFLEFVEQPNATTANTTNATNASVPTKLTENKYCTRHAEQQLNHYCTKCKAAICETCKTDKHSSHPVQDTTEVAKAIRGTLGHFLAAIKEYLPEYEDYVKKSRQSQKELDKDLENAIKDVQSRSRFLQREIEKIGQQLIGELKESHKAESEALDKDVRQVINAYKSVATVASSAERMLKLGSDMSVIDASNRIQKRFMQVEDELPSVSRETVKTVGFVPGGLKAQTLPTLFGQCTKGEIALPTLPIPWGIRVAKEIEMRSISCFRVRNVAETIHAIAPISTSEAWICCGWGSKDVHLYTINGERKKTVTLDIQVDHICTTPGGEVLVSSYEDKYIRKIKKDYEVCEFAIPHLYPGGMVMTKRKELYVCAVDSYTTRRASHSRRCIMKMSEHGMNIDEIDEYGDTILFGAPYRITEGPNRVLCVTDREEGKLRVTVIDNEGAIQHVYNGPKEVKMKQPFNPLGLCCDRAGQILVTDWGNHCVHLVNNEGQFQGFILSQKDGLFKPNAMALDKAGNLWIGDGKSTVRVYKYGKRET